MSRHLDLRADISVLAELNGIYRDADVLFADHSCPASTECCRFGVTGREPYVTSIELTLLLQAIRARGGMPRTRRVLPLVDQGVCPLLDREGRCSVYLARPFGCRSFWCERTLRPDRVPHREVQRLVRRLQQVAARHEPDGDRGRPLRRALRLDASSLSASRR